MTGDVSLYQMRIHFRPSSYHTSGIAARLLFTRRIVPEQWPMAARRLATGMNVRAQCCLDSSQDWCIRCCLGSVFGQIKNNIAYLYFRHFGREKIIIYLSFFAIAFNIKKLCNLLLKEGCGHLKTSDKTTFRMDFKALLHLQLLLKR